ncbi:A disintegrin and metalloproteinase with thrombospondin motifs 3 [Aplysia californica]|uniref:A disintegrin and metalloproteinase with thrombospondin motifs 3 n=2 Tax=Aplysia californica TaxID=6500 RepID=A0ABM0K7U6_APLCA|nr:A disintegrin and metalloproteinase with thrombospondin motifs 3 [Aplysia californica]
MAVPASYVTSLLLLLSVCLQAAVVYSQQSDSSDFKLPCKAKRTEISFPEVTDVSGPVSLAEGASPSDFLNVTLQWRSQKLDVLLFRNLVTSPGTLTEWEEGNVTYAQVSDKQCFYVGYIVGQDASYVALSACDGLAGYIQTEDELVFVEPAARPSHDNKLAHTLYTCEAKMRVPQPDFYTESTAQHMHRRRRAARPPKYLEVMVVVDHSLVNAIGSRERTELYVMSLMNIANTVYQHKTLGVDIRVVVIKIVFLEKRQQREVLRRRDAFATVNKFCAWSQRQIPAGQPMNYDISVLITKEELGPSGYAPITGLCNPTRSCAAVRDEGFTTGFVIAHEMAHVFGLFHDGHGNHCHGRKYQTSMMAALVESRLNHFWWSDCSSRRMKDMIRYLHCLDNVPTPIEDHYKLEAEESIHHRLGKSWSLDFQCRMEFGPRFRLCSAFYNDPCATLWCASDRSHMCRTKRGPPLSGSPCGRDRECRHARCQYVGNQRPVNGFWSPWSSWSECSSECGVGVRQRSRACDNPAPQYEGKDCEGETDKWDTCVNNKCEVFEDVRAGECAIWDGLQIRYGTHKWQPFEGFNASTMCKQTCQSFYTDEVVTIDVDVSDGTPCSYTGNNSNICMMGKCLDVGCDGKINSTKRADRCGMCEGDGSECKVVQGYIVKKAKSPHAYVEKLLTIPGNARDIRIVKTTKTQHFLAIEDPRYGKFVLNGDKRQSKSKRLVINGAMFSYFRGNKTFAESITSPGPLLARLELQMFPKGAKEEFNVSFSYVVHKSDNTYEKNMFKWKFSRWSECSVTCGQGVQTIVHACRNKDTDQEVPDENCRVLKTPRKDKVACRRERCGIVKYNFAMVNEYSECNATCGQDGTQTQMFRCERMFLRNRTQEEVGMRSCAHLTKPDFSRMCKGPPCKPVESFDWSAGQNWTDCPCGPNNTQSRDVFCDKVTTTGDNRTVERVDTAACGEVDGRPAENRTCEGEPCGPTFQWNMTEEYSLCNAECGETGNQTAILTCLLAVKSSSGFVYEAADDYLCEKLPKPEDVIRNCTGEPCEIEERFQWQATEEWSDCDASCDDQGVATRVFQCQRLDHNGSSFNVSDDQCDVIPAANETRKCQGPSCPLKWTLGEWSECSVTCGEGKNYRKVHCGDPDTDLDDIRCTDTPPATSKKCSQPRCKELYGKNCKDMYSFCKTYSALRFRCKRSSFRRKCCQTCKNSGSEANRPAPKNALERYMMKRRLGRWR